MQLVPIPCLFYSIRARSTDSTANSVAERNFPLGATAPTLPTSSGFFYGSKLKNPQIAGRGVTFSSR